VLQCFVCVLAVCWQCAEVCCVLSVACVQCVAECYSVLQCAVVCCDDLQRVADVYRGAEQQQRRNSQSSRSLAAQGIQTRPVCMYVYMNIRIYIYMHACLYVCIYVYIYMHVCISCIN